MRSFYLLTLGMLVLVACSQKKEEAGTPESLDTQQQVEEPRNRGPQQLSEDAYQVTASGLRYAILKPSDGPKPKRGDKVVVHYKGWLRDGTKFDSSYDRGQTIKFVLGAGQVIPGWDEGISLLHVGERAQLVLPPELAYGERGIGPIPPNSTLIFEVEIVGIE